jgi:5-(carboxyamino)imidazole ribonucleotide synthase
MKRVGILGGGQLGSLLLESLYRLGATVSVYDPDKSAPACKRTPNSFNGDWLNEELLTSFLTSCDVATYEFENVESKSLAALSHLKPIFPSIDVLRTTQDRALEKTFLSQNDLPHVDFKIIDSLAELPAAAESFGFPFILKTARGGYDGKGQFLIQSPTDLSQFSHDAKAPPRQMVLERQIGIRMEVSCIVARSANGEEVSFPVFENVHSEHILDLTVVPARISRTLEIKIKEIAIAAARALNVTGLLTTEFFLTDEAGNNSSGYQVGDWYVYINEFAPRPHNSGHVSMKACTISQFDALARILLDIPLVEPSVVAPGYYCMGNLLGDVWLAQGANQLDLTSMASHPCVIDVVLYGKEEPRAKRKMGHFVTYANSAEAAVNEARKFRSALSHPSALAKPTYK